MTATAAPDGDDVAGYRAVATLHNALMTGIVLTLVSRRGAEVAREFLFRHFRRQHHEKFLPGLKKLGLDRLPHAVACAQYHFLSNAVGGVKTEYLAESDRKAWVRYPPPRWIWRGTAICAIPHEVSAAMLHGWHGHNGVSLGNPRLGFVCTGMTVDGMAGLEGYYIEHDRPLAPEERVRFAYGKERMPRVDPASQPALDVATWPAARLARVHRSYAMEYFRSLAPTLVELLGRDDARAEIGRTARLIGLQYHEETAAMLGPPEAGAAGFARYLARMLAAHGESIELDLSGDRAVVRQDGWKLMRGVPFAEEADEAAAFEAWSQTWIGAAGAHDRFLAVAAERTPGPGARWTITTT